MLTSHSITVKSLLTFTLNLLKNINTCYILYVTPNTLNELFHSDFRLLDFTVFVLLTRFSHSALMNSNLILINVDIICFFFLNQEKRSKNIKYSSDIWYRWDPSWTNWVRSSWDSFWFTPKQYPKYHSVAVFDTSQIDLRRCLKS